MTDKKITELDATTALAAVDLVVVVVGPTTTKKMTIANFFGETTGIPVEMFHLKSSTSDKPVFKLENTTDNASSAELRFYKTPGAANITDNDRLGQVIFYGDDDGGTERKYAVIAARATDVTAADFASRLEFSITMDTALRSMLRLEGYNGSVNEGAITINADGQDVDTIIQAVGVADALSIQGSDGQFTVGALGSGDVQSSAAGVLSVTSDKKLKTHLGYLEDGALEKILQFKPTYFTFKSDEDTYIYIEKDYEDDRGNIKTRRVKTDKKRFTLEQIKQLGFYANDVNPIQPEAAPYDKEKDLYGFNSRAMVALLVKGMQEQQAQIDELKERIEVLESE